MGFVNHTVCGGQWHAFPHLPSGEELVGPVSGCGMHRQPSAVSPFSDCFSFQSHLAQGHIPPGGSHTMTNGCSSIWPGRFGPTQDNSFYLHHNPWDWLRLWGLFCNFSLCQALLPSLSVPGCFLQEHTLINILHSKLGLRVCFLG